MNQSNDHLSDALRRLKDDDASMAASTRVEVVLREEVRTLAAQRRRRTRMLFVQVAATVTLIVASVAWWAWTHHKTGPEITATAEAPAQEIATEYFPLFYSSVPARSLQVVRLEVSRASMARFGLLSGDALNRATGTVLADVLVGEDGLARAVRFVQKVSQEP
jgi:hypothetical protein